MSTAVHFNPRSREGSDDYTSRRDFLSRRFQSTLPRRERLGTEFSTQRVVTFQSTLPRRERQQLKLTHLTMQDFNPRSREGSDSRFCSASKTKLISIHAPAKGATAPMRALGLTTDISIHAPAKGATYTMGTSGVRFDISIHAPAKGATFQHIPTFSLNFLISIHAPAKGATKFFAKPILTKEISIHAPAKGATRNCYIYAVLVYHFNPRSREGSDSASCIQSCTDI